MKHNIFVRILKTMMQDYFTRLMRDDLFCITNLCIGLALFCVLAFVVLSLITIYMHLFWPVFLVVSLLIIVGSIAFEVHRAIKYIIGVYNRANTICIKED